MLTHSRCLYLQIWLYRSSRCARVSTLFQQVLDSAPLKRQGLSAELIQRIHTSIDPKSWRGSLIIPNPSVTFFRLPQRTTRHAQGATAEQFCNGNTKPHQRTSTLGTKPNPMAKPEAGGSEVHLTFRGAVLQDCTHMLPAGKALQPATGLSSITKPAKSHLRDDWEDMYKEICHTAICEHPNVLQQN